MDIPLDEVIHFDGISSASTGAAVDADSTPTFAVYEEATDTDIGVGGNMTKRTSLTGNYRGSFTASAANGFEVGKWYNVIGSATIGAIATKGILKSFRIVLAESVVGEPKVDVGAFGGSAGIFSGGRPEVNATHVGGTSQTGRDIGASVLLSSGTGTGQLKLASGYVAMTWADIAAPTTTVNLSGTTVKTATDVETDTADIQSRLPAALTADGNMKADALRWAGTLIVATSIPVGTAAGASGGLLISGSNSGTTTLGALTVTGATTLSGAVSLGSTLGITGAITATNASNNLTLGTFTVTTNAIAWPAAWDAEVQSECADALVAYDGLVPADLPTNFGALLINASGHVSRVTLVDTATLTTTVTNLTNSPTAGDFTATMKTSLNAATPASVVGNVGGISGTINTLDQLDTAQDSQHTTTQGLVNTVDTVVDAIKVITDALTALAAARLALSAAQIIPGTIDTAGFSPTTTQFEADDITEATADHYNGRIVIFTSGQLVGQATDITDYSLATGRGHFTVTALTEAAGNNDTFIIV